MPDQHESVDITTTSLQSLLGPAMKAVDSEIGRGPWIPGLSTVATGFADLDELTGGLWRGRLWVITGRSGSGKSVLGLDLARRAAIRQSVLTAIVQAREPASDVASRLMSAEARIPLHHLQHHGLDGGDLARLSRRVDDCAKAPLMVTTVATSDNATPTADSLLDAAATLLAAEGTRLLVIDDLPSNTTADQLGQLKALAVQSGCCIVALLASSPRTGLKRVERTAMAPSPISCCGSSGTMTWTHGSPTRGAVRATS